MKLYYWRSKHGNFGDDLNPWLWPRLLGDLLCGDDTVLFVGIGTILDNKIPSSPIKVVFGSGCWGHALPIINHGRWRVYCVRGPRTAKALCLPPELAVTDPAALVRVVLKHEFSKHHRVSFMPHHESPLYADWRSLCMEAGIHYIDPCGHVETVMRDIGESELLLADAMHGAIVADALRVPWLPTRVYDRRDDFKWWDWLASLELQHRFARFPRLWSSEGFVHRLRQSEKLAHFWRAIGPTGWRVAEKLGDTWGRVRGEAWRRRALIALKRASQMEPMLSLDNVLQARIATLMERLELLKQERRMGRI
jgi:succinoglycan biosynthesis protein ExoV